MSVAAANSQQILNLNFVLFVGAPKSCADRGPDDRGHDFIDAADTDREPGDLSSCRAKTASIVSRRCRLKSRSSGFNLSEPAG
jgi:hypothetical protein